MRFSFRDWARRNKRPVPARSRPSALFETLESRTLLSVVTVNTNQTVRSISGPLVGTNVTWWQGELNTTQMQQMVAASGMEFFRMAGGSSIDANTHFNVDPYQGYNTPPIIANFIQAVGGAGLVTTNYGTGSPQEAAAYLAYFDASPTDTTSIGMGEQWNTTSNTWVQVDWKTAGYWASLRAATPLAQDDGLNFLRANHPASWNINYFEIGNEEYATWEMDEHGTGGDTGAPHDPTTYINFAKTFSTLAHQINPNVKIGLDVTPPLQFNLPDQSWTTDLLTKAAQVGFTPDFLDDHVYIGGLSDQNLLLNSTSNPNYTGWQGVSASWVGRAQWYQGLINQDLGSAGAGVQLITGEFNADLGTKQSTSLVDGLFVADSIGQMLQTQDGGMIQWDLTNGFSPLSPNSNLYGWRNGSDDGLISTGSGPAPASGAYVPYPAYFAESLISKLVDNGTRVVSVSTDNISLTAYGVMQSNGHLALLLINKDPANNLTDTFQIQGFTPNGQVSISQYGKAEDTAQSQTTDGHASLTLSNTTLSLSGNNFSFTLPSYSMTVIDLTPNSTPTVAQAAAANPSSVTGATTQLSALGADDGGEANLIYTWSLTSGPASVLFSANGTNASKSSAATFSKAGAYSFLVTIKDAGGLSVTSSVSVTVNQTLTSIAITPAPASVAANGTQQFSASGKDQFGNVLSSQPAFTWSLQAGSVGSINATGLYTAPATSGSATVIAKSGSVQSTAGVTVTAGTTGLPAGWTDSDIGSPALAGSASVTSGTWTLNGGGADIWSGSNQFNYASESISGDTTIIAHIDTLTNTNSWAKAGVMFRDGTSATAAYIDLVISAGNGLALQYRTTASGSPQNVQIAGKVVPLWVKLVRTGNSFTGFYSSNGATWTAIGSAVTITMAAPTAGLAITAHDNTKLATATFDSVSVATGTTTSHLLSGAAIGTAGSWNNSGNTIAKVFDGNLSTFFDAPTGNGDWVGLDLGSPQNITQIAFAPRSGFTNRMVGGVFQVSNTADFSSGVTTIYTVTAAPTAGSLTTIPVSPGGTFRYIRYLSPNGGFGNIAEFEVFGT